MNVLLGTGNGMRQVIDGIVAERALAAARAALPDSSPAPVPGKKKTKHWCWWARYGDDASLALENMPHRLEHDMFAELRRA